MRKLSHNSKVMFFVQAVANTVGIKGREIALTAGYSQSSYINWTDRPYKNYENSVASECYMKAVCELYEKRYFGSYHSEVAACCSIFALYVSKVRMFYSWDEEIMREDYLKNGLDYIQAKLVDSNTQPFEKVKKYIFGGNN